MSGKLMSHDSVFRRAGSGFDGYYGRLSSARSGARKYLAGVLATGKDAMGTLYGLAEHDLAGDYLAYTANEKLPLFCDDEGEMLFIPELCSRYRRGCFSIGIYSDTMPAPASYHEAPPDVYVPDDSGIVPANETDEFFYLGEYVGLSEGGIHRFRQRVHSAFVNAFERLGWEDVTRQISAELHLNPKRLGRQLEMPKEPV